jgi:hypothetical protein
MGEDYTARRAAGPRLGGVSDFYSTFGVRLLRCRDAIEEPEAARTRAPTRTPGSYVNPLLGSDALEIPQSVREVPAADLDPTRVVRKLSSSSSVP